MTNGDKIRAMTDKELAAYIAGDILGNEGVSFAISAEAWFWKFQQGEEEPFDRCEGCIYSKGKRPQKCACCCRNQWLKDCYTEKEDKA